MTVDQPALEELLRQILASRPECNCEAQHNGSKSNSEGDQHSLLGDAQLFEDHGQHEYDDDGAHRNAQKAGRSQVGIDCGQQRGAREEAGGEQSEKHDKQSRKQTRQERKEARNLLMQSKNSEYVDAEKNESQQRYPEYKSAQQFRRWR